MRVIDSSSLVKFFSREEGWMRVEEFIRQGVASLDLSVKEVANALWKKALIGEIKAEDAEEILKDLAASDAVKIQSQNDYLLGAFRIAVRRKITVYDAFFIELAKEAGVELVTSDGKQAKAAREDGVKVKII